MTITDANTSRQNEENTEQIMENTAIDTQNITNIDNTAQLDSQSESIIEVRHLGKIFGTHEVLKDIDFDVQKGDVTCIIGSSGSGKSTLLRCINLFETPTAGEIYFHGEDVTKTKSAPKYREKVTMVFQSFNLFNNLSVLANCTIGPRKVLKMKKDEANAVAMKYLELVGMSAYINAKPRQLSGGQNNAWQLRAPLRCPPKSSCLTSPLPLSIPKWWAKCSKS